MTSITRQIIKKQNELFDKSGVMPDLCIVCRKTAMKLRVEFLSGEPDIIFDMKSDDAKIGDMKLTISRYLGDNSCVITKVIKDYFDSPINYNFGNKKP